MSEPPSAAIIPFPRPKAAEEANGPVRLQRAFATLERALAEQRAAVAAWRESLGDLRGSVQGLSQSLGTYQARLDGLAEGVDGLNREARRLEAWADGVLAPRVAGSP